MDYDTAMRRFRNDARFNALVKFMVEQIEALKFSPGEMMQAATFAQIVFEQSRSAHNFKLVDDQA